MLDGKSPDQIFGALMTDAEVLEEARKWRQNMKFHLSASLVAAVPVGLQIEVSYNTSCINLWDGRTIKFTDEGEPYFVRDDA